MYESKDKKKFTSKKFPPTKIKNTFQFFFIMSLIIARFFLWNHDHKIADKREL